MMKRNIGVLRNDGIEAGISISLPDITPDWDSDSAPAWPTTKTK